MVRAWASDHMSAAGWAVEQRTRPRAPSPSTDDGTSGTLRPPARLVCAARALALFQDSNSRPVHRSIRCKGMEWENVPPQKELMHEQATQKSLLDLCVGLDQQMHASYCIQDLSLFTHHSVSAGALHPKPAMCIHLPDCIACIAPVSRCRRPGAARSIHGSGPPPQHMRDDIVAVEPRASRVGPGATRFSLVAMMRSS